MPSKNMGLTPWSKRHRRKLKVRSLEQQEITEAAIESIADTYAFKWAKEDRTKSWSLFKHFFKKKPRFAGTFWDDIRERKDRFSVRNANAHYTKAIIETMAVYEYVCSLGRDDFKDYIESALRKLGMDTPPQNLDLLKVVLQLVIDYRDTVDGVPAIDAHALSRDAVAIRWLMDVRKLKSFQVAKLQKREGGGVDRWSREASKTANDADRMASILTKDHGLKTDDLLITVWKRLGSKAILLAAEKMRRKGPPGLRRSRNKTKWDTIRTAVENNL